MLGARVLAIAVEPETEMDDVERRGLLVIPKDVKKDNTPRPTTGIVVAVGPAIPCYMCGRTKWEHDDRGWVCCAAYDPTLREGDMIMFPKFAGNEHIISEESMRIMDEKEVMCTLVDTEEVVREVSCDETNLG